MSFQWSLTLTNGAIALLQALAAWEDSLFAEEFAPFARSGMYVAHYHILDREGLVVSKEGPPPHAKGEEGTFQKHMSHFPVLTLKGRRVLELIELDIKACEGRQVDGYTVIRSINRAKSEAAVDRRRKQA